MRLLIFLALVAVAQAGVDRRQQLRAEQRRSLPLLNNAPMGIRDDGERIYNGQVATHGQFPSQAAVMVDGTKFCGGSLISSTMVLTTGGCADSFWGQYEVWLGAQKRSVDEPERLVLATSRSIIHAYYDPQTGENNIALLELQPVTFTEFIQPARLPRLSEKNKSFASAKATLSGWGNFGSFSGLSDELMYIESTVLSNEQCASYVGFVADSAMCLANTGGMGGCTGDTGAPMMYQEPDGLWTQIGTMSGYYSSCALLPTPLTRVTFYMTWLQQNGNIVFRP